MGKAMKQSINNFKQFQIASIIFMFILVIVGGLLFEFDMLSQRNLSIIFGAVFIVDGLFSLIKYLYDGISSKVYVSEIVVSVVGIILGVFSLINKTNITKIIGVTFGIWLLAKGIINGLHAFKFRKVNEEIYPLVTFISVLIIIMGIISIFHPFSTFILITKLMALFTAVYGILQILVSLLFRKRAEQVLKIYS